MDVAEWSELLQGIKRDGYIITHTDWHQERFELNKDGNPVSDTRFTIQGSRNNGQDRMEVKATVRVAWRVDGKRYRPVRVEVIEGKVRRRSAK